MENTTYYIANAFNGVAFKSMKDLKKYYNKRQKYTLGEIQYTVRKYTYLPKGVRLLTNICSR